MKTLLVLAMMTLCAGCVTAGGVDTKCLTEKATRMTDKEIAALTPETARKILADNESGAKRCGWKPNQ